MSETTRCAHGVYIPDCFICYPKPEAPTLGRQLVDALKEANAKHSPKDAGALTVVDDALAQERVKSAALIEAVEKSMEAKSDEDGLNILHDALEKWSKP